MNTTRKNMLPILLLTLTATSLQAATITWIGRGGDGFWSTPANWDANKVPESSDDVIITNGSVNYVAGRDLSIGSGCTMLVGAGGSFVQTGTDSWIRIDGNVVVQKGGVFDSGSAGQLHLTGSFTLEPGGTLIRHEKNLNAGAAWLFNGGTVDLGMGEFQFRTTVDFAGVLYAGQMAPQDGEAILNFTGGHIFLRDSRKDSFFQPGAACLNFPLKSTGIVSITNCTPEAVYSRYFEGNTPRMRYNGEPVSVANFPNLIGVEKSSSMENGVDIFIRVKKPDVFVPLTTFPE